jgi:hypothetical protein
MKDTSTRGPAPAGVTRGGRKALVKALGLTQQVAAAG